MTTSPRDELPFDDVADFENADRGLTLVPPTLDITRTGQTETVDGVRIVFQITPAPRPRPR